MSKWIKCSDQLPEYNTYVLIVTPYGDIFIALFTKTEYSYPVRETLIQWETDHRGIGYCDWDIWSLNEIKYWQPLPELPEE